jgi:hypothetical protein
MERRREIRRDHFARAQVTFKSPAGTSESADGTVQDRSPKGLCIRLGKPLPIGAEIIVVEGKWTQTGQVRRCEREGFEWVLGVLLSEAGTSECNS